MSPRFYILDGTTPVPCEDFHLWREWFRSSAPLTVVGDERAGCARVKTVFLGTHDVAGPPLLFETSVKGGKYDGERRQYATWSEALHGHEEALARVQPGSG